MNSPASPFAALRVLLFDLDGTLIQTRIDFPRMTRTVADMAGNAGVPGSVLAGRDVLSAIDAAASHLRSQGKGGDMFRAEAWAELERQEWDGCASPLLVPGADALLTLLKERGVQVGIVTRNCRAVSQWMLQQFPLPHGCLVTRDDTPRFKPAPEHLWHALSLLKASPADAGMCGDHWMDVQAGQAAHCAATLGVLGNHSEDWFAPCPPTVSVTDLTAALPLFGG